MAWSEAATGRRLRHGSMTSIVIAVVEATNAQSTSVLPPCLATYFFPHRASRPVFGGIGLPPRSLELGTAGNVGVASGLRSVGQARLIIFGAIGGHMLFAAHAARQEERE